MRSQCAACSQPLRPSNFAANQGVYYCLPHFKQKFKEKGNYDEGFGRQQHKDKWKTAAAGSNSELSGASGSQVELEKVGKGPQSEIAAKLATGSQSNLANSHGKGSQSNLSTNTGKGSQPNLSSNRGNGSASVLAAKHSKESLSGLTSHTGNGSQPKLEYTRGKGSQNELALPHTASQNALTSTPGNGSQPQLNFSAAKGSVSELRAKFGPKVGAPSGSANGKGSQAELSRQSGAGS
jgi:hypothetical protein